MKKILSLLAVALFPLIAFCQWTNNPLLNTVVSDDPSVDETVPLTAEGPDGKTYVSYFKSVGGNYEMHMQLLDSLGNKLWGTTGITVSSFPQNSALYRYDLKSDLQGDAIVAFQDERLGYLSTVAYKIDASGTFVWGANGIQLGDSLATQDLAPAIGITSGNNAVIAWNSINGSAKWLAFKKISAAGNVMWSRTHRIIDSTNVKKFSRAQVAALDNDRFLMMYIQETGSFPFTNTLFVQKYDVNGDAVAGTPTQVSTKTTSFVHFPKVVAKNREGIFIGFDTSNPVSLTLNDVYAQYVDSSLNVNWTTTGVELASSTTDHKNIASLHYMPDSNQVFCVMKYLDGSQGSAGVLLQRLDMAGTKILGANAYTLYAYNPSYYEPYGAGDAGDGMIVVYALGTFGNEHLLATKVDYNGSFMWAAPTADLSTTNSNKLKVSVCSFRNGQVVTVWEDDRSGSGDGIYAQNILNNGSIGLPTGISDVDGGNWKMGVYPNPSSYAPDVFVNTELRENFSMTLTDGCGKLLWKKEFASAGNGRQRIHLADEVSLPAGMYLLNVRSENKSVSLKVLITNQY